MSNAFPRSTRVRRALASIGVPLLLTLLASACGDPVTDGTGQPIGSGPAVEIVVSAASDLSPVLEELVPLFEQQSGIVVKTNLGSTGQLAEQISAGAKVDVFLAASASAVDQLGQKGLLLANSARIYARGQLVLWTPAGSEVTVASLRDLASPEVKRISLANPDHAPYGKAAREALQDGGALGRTSTEAGARGERPRGVPVRLHRQRGCGPRGAVAGDLRRGHVRAGAGGAPPAHRSDPRHPRKQCPSGRSSGVRGLPHEWARRGHS